MGEDRRATLQPFDLFAVVAELQEEMRLRAERQLGVDDLVAPAPARARTLDAAQKVGPPDELPVEERRLSDRLRAGVHRRKRFGFGGPHRFERVDQPWREDDEAFAVLGAEALEHPPFVLLAFGRDQPFGFVGRGAHGFTHGDATLEPAEVHAFEIVVEIGRRIDEATADELHLSLPDRCTTYPAWNVCSLRLRQQPVTRRKRGAGARGMK